MLKKFFTVPYIRSISENCLPIYKCNFKLSYSIRNTLKNLITRGKNRLDHLANQNVIYKIFCDN